MQRGRSALNSFPEPFDLNQGSLPENTSMDHSTSWNNMLNPVENRLSNYILGTTDGNVSCINATDGAAQSFSGWDRGESSSSANNMQDGACGADSKTKLGWSSSFNACSGLDARSEDWSFPPSNATSSSNSVTGRPLTMQSSNDASMNLNLNDGQSWNHDCHRGSGAVLPHNIYKSGQSAMDQNPTFYASSSNIGIFSGRSSTSSENYDLAGPSFGSWGSSCKRKALEGTSGQFYPGGSSSANQPMDKSIMQHPAHGSYNTSGNLSISSGPVNLSSTNLVEQVNPSIGVGMSRVAPSPFPSSSVPGVAESSARHFAVRLNHGRHGPNPFDIPRSSSMRSSGVYTSHLSRPMANTDSAELRSSITLPMNQNNSLTQPHLMPVNEARGTHSYPWNGSLSSRGGSSSSSFIVSGERDHGAPEEINVRSSRRNNLEYPMTVSAPETRNVLPDQIDWSFAPGTSASSRNNPTGSRIGPSSGGRSYSGSWLPHQSPSSQNHQRLSESFPWIPIHRVESESGTSRSHFSLLPSASSSSDEAANSSRHHLDQRSAALLMDIPGDDINGRRSLAAVEGRHRLIRQVLNAMRRGVHLQAEDYMLIDPFVNGFAELHDRHRDMRLDVDNMSYEELLALEERIGNVSTGLSEEQISGSMKQCKYEATGSSLPNMEPCCICQEDYISGEDIGILKCGHEFHTSCIKQWLTLKNLCPICKTTALET
ncbi:E3 ubiquitin-protein ligase MBR2-like [Salvia miltiorrhiza]|uniref:E3 ubiquitin-protein ligase MBR2-like n=1 Tax=Salvia miltiorrhiza TaxID=226208 RepID=UPI0025ACA6E5|nr:E3 ubiquitin-protein ligase MBR2-like [Salvia miltiorrhiza]XP_057787388.1 E3 ubiquitin-protein ligase MBR2-like [Salvia miltiorrhiza]XP_057787389.1 E3 ubiquitin-protein ligase MBR2-like [Salvia miltiorrhiza]XP_057787390.1 E3 ubiquitin-protein ligase MBR2-like [Salvia miltiorrhiza]XP_057787391.1 E3 ubiquitin-protein ligase MBR2-like [Salvia miltiorrhiza]XP_057787392.1 E3 ubiquitin-protein ligase MBR2-like [Salvia miltiorrhiza]XP_057787393.1 E3 ubiquitin-protein ligase MBR2-like [Salvia milt